MGIGQYASGAKMPTKLKYTYRRGPGREGVTPGTLGGFPPVRLIVRLVTFTVKLTGKSHQGRMLCVHSDGLGK
jgi:hypothetical protein